MSSDNLTACPVCKVTWLGDEIPDGLMAANPDFYDTREKAEEAAAAYGWTKKNKRKFKTNMMGVEYPHNHPQHYDGVSEWKCTACGLRIGRWSGNYLKIGEVEPRYGVYKPPKVMVPDNEDFKWGQ